MTSKSCLLDGFEPRDDAPPQQPAAGRRLKPRSNNRDSGRCRSALDASDGLPLLDLMAHAPSDPPEPRRVQTSRAPARHGAATTQYALIGRLGGLAKSARHDARASTIAARAGLRAKFIREADPEGRLSADERQRRAEALMRLHMSRLALRSAQVRRQRKTALP